MSEYIMLPNEEKHLIISVGSTTGLMLGAIRPALGAIYGASGVRYLALDTNRHITSLQKEGIETLVLGPNCRRGKGAGQVAKNGKDAFEESRDEFVRMLGDLSGVEGATVFFAPTRGGTGAGASVPLLLTLRELGITTVPVLFWSSELKSGAAPAQLTQGREVLVELDRNSIKHFCLNWDYLHQDPALRGLVQQEAIARLYTLVVDSIAKIAQFYAGTHVLDPGDLEVQVLNGAGHLKVADAPLAFEADRVREEVVQAFGACVDHPLYTLEGELGFVASFLQGPWTPAHMEVLGECIHEYALQNGSKEFCYKSISVSPEQSGADGRLTLLFSTRRAMGEPAGKESKPVVRPAVLPRAAIPLRVRVQRQPPTQAQLERIESLKLRVYKGVRNPEDISLLGLFQGVVNREQGLPATILEGWEPREFVELLNFMRVELDPRAEAYEPGAEEILSCFVLLRERWSEDEVVRLLHANYEHGKDRAADKAGELWLPYLYQRCQGKVPFPFGKVRLSTGGKWDVRPDMSVDELARCESQCTDADQRQRIRQARIVMRMFGPPARNMWNNLPPEPHSDSAWNRIAQLWGGKQPAANGKVVSDLVQ